MIRPMFNYPEKALAAEVFYKRYVAARQHREYTRQKSEHVAKHESA